MRALLSDSRPALLFAQPLGIRLNSTKCGLQRRRHDRRGGMRCSFPRKRSRCDLHCFSLRGNRARRSRCCFLGHHPVQFGVVSGCHSRRQENWPPPPQRDARVENCRAEVGSQLEWCVPLCHVGKSVRGYRLCGISSTASNNHLKKRRHSAGPRLFRPALPAPKCVQLSPELKQNVTAQSAGRKAPRPERGEARRWSLRHKRALHQSFNLTFDLSV